MGPARPAPGEALDQLCVTRDRGLEWALGREPRHHVGDLRHAWASGSWATSVHLLGEPLPALLAREDHANRSVSARRHQMGTVLRDTRPVVDQDELHPLPFEVRAPIAYR